MELAIYTEGDMKKALAELQTIAKGVIEIMAGIKDIQAKITKLQADLAAEKNAEDATVQLLNTITGQLATANAQLRDALANQDLTAIQAAADQLDALDTTVKANTNTLAQAVVQGTPAAASA